MGVITTHGPPEDDVEGVVPGSSANHAPVRSYATAWLYLFDWYPSHYSPLEKKMLRKLDSVLLTFGCLAFLVKKLDTSNLHNAYVSGMKEDLHLYGNQYSLFHTFYDLGYLLCQIPCILLVSRPSFATYFIPCMEVCWALITFGQAAVKNVDQVYGCRFALGVLETPVSSGLFFIFASWYRPSELFKRAGVWYTSFALGGIFSGQLQAAAYRHLNGVNGIAGWRWLYILDGCISLPIAILGFALFPGLPAAKKPWWMTRDEHEMARRRVKDAGIKQSRPSIFSKVLLKRVFTKWHFYVAVLLYTFYLSSVYPTSQMGLYLKSEAGKSGHHVQQINQIPTGVQAVSAVALLISTSLCMVYPVWIIVTVIQFIILFAVIVLRVWKVPLTLHFFAYFLLGFTSCLPPIVIPWVNILMKDDAEARAVTTGAMIMFGSAVSSFYPITVFPVLQAPRWKRGYTVTIIFVSMVWILFMLGTYLNKRDMRRSEALKARDEERTDDEVSSMELAGMDEKGEKSKVQVIHIEEKD
ncbi:MFS general substrate transporter [Stipitochalara longipes BDJ]|nr:MFS general substrate transporter [Stipitochalara longipes BDJ]